MATVLDTLTKGTAYLEKHGVEDARLNMQHLLAHVLKCDRMQLYLDYDHVLEESHLAPLRDFIRRRAGGEPLQHLLGTVEFCGREFVSDNRALVPRPETEELAERLSKRRWPEDARILDMGTGSGVLGLTLAAELGEGVSEAVLADVSAEALDLAQENAGRLGLTRVRLVEGDLFENIDGAFHLIAANLPYVADSEKTELSREVRNDPERALFGGETGTEIMERFLAECPAHLHPGGVVAMEFGIGQGNALREAADSAAFESVEILKDISGHERFLFAVKTAEPG